MKLMFENKVVLVTGGALGIGRVTALAFAREGAKVCIADILDQEGNETVDMIHNRGGEAFYIPCDVSNEKEVSRLISTIIERYGCLDVAFNNAGIFKEEKAIEEGDTLLMDQMLDVNFKSVWFCMKYEIREMLKNGGGAICNNSSIAGIISEAGCPVYTASKFAVDGLTKTLAVDYASKGIRISAVCGSAIKSNMLQQFVEDTPEVDMLSYFAHECPSQRIGETEELAEAVLFLCSDYAVNCIGACMPVDGGLMTAIGACIE